MRQAAGRWDFLQLQARRSGRPRSVLAVRVYPGGAARLSGCRGREGLGVHSTHRPGGPQRPAGDDELAALSHDVSEKYRQIIADKKSAGLAKLQGRLTKELGIYVSNGDVRLAWEDIADVDLSPPRAVASLGEDGYLS